MKKTKCNLKVLNGFQYCLIDSLLLENTILQKKLNGVELSKNEFIFDTFMVSPSFLIKQLMKGVSSNEIRN